MIFFISISNIAAAPANNIVIIPIKSNLLVLFELEKTKFKRTIKYTPAVTRVEEWTSAETGVGAAIAAGNQAEKGIWALLVQADNIKINTSNEFKDKLLEDKYL